jgi:anaerobic selenocysteine-containing dehydrogenase
MQRLGIGKDQWVDLISHFESETRRVERFKAIPYQIPAGCAATYFPEANALVPLRDVAEKSNQPASKSLVITIEASVFPGQIYQKGTAPSEALGSPVAK